MLAFVTSTFLSIFASSSPTFSPRRVSISTTFSPIWPIFFPISPTVSPIFASILCSDTAIRESSLCTLPSSESAPSSFSSALSGSCKSSSSSQPPSPMEGSSYTAASTLSRFRVRLSVVSSSPFFSCAATGLRLRPDS